MPQLPSSCSIGTLLSKQSRMTLDHFLKLSNIVKAGASQLTTKDDTCLPETLLALNKLQNLET